MRSIKLAGKSSAYGNHEEVVTPFTVMIIDDCKSVRRSVAQLLAREGYLVITAADGFEALGMIAEQRPDLIFMDISMPRLDGYQACALIKHHKVYRHIPIVMLSSDDGVFDRAHGGVVGADHCIGKPLTREDMLSAIESYGSNTANRRKA